MTDNNVETVNNNQKEAQKVFKHPRFYYANENELNVPEYRSFNHNEKNVRFNETQNCYTHRYKSGFYDTAINKWINTPRIIRAFRPL